MHLLEFTFSDTEFRELSDRATHILQAFKPLTFASIGPIAREEHMDLAALACTTTLYDVLGKHHPIFNLPHRPDVLFMHNVPSHANAALDERFNPDLFMTLGLTGPLKQRLRGVEIAQVAPAWHQDVPAREGHGDGAMITLYCVNPGIGKVPTDFASTDLLLDHLPRNHGFNVTKDSQGLQLFHLPRFERDTITDHMKNVPFISIEYSERTMAVFRDLRMVHRTGVPINPETGAYDKSPKGRHMHRNVMQGEASYDYASSPELALANVRIAAAAKGASHAKF